MVFAQPSKKEADGLAVVWCFDGFPVDDSRLEMKVPNSINGLRHKLFSAFPGRLCTGYPEFFMCNMQMQERAVLINHKTDFNPTVGAQSQGDGRVVRWKA